MTEINKHTTLWLCLLLAVLVVIPYLQIGDHPFINFDDQRFIVENRHVNSGLTIENLGWAFSSGDLASWQPVTWISHMIDFQLFGTDAGPHHLVNLGLHLANTLLLFLILYSMTGGLWQSFFVAALFGLHPMHVESVAWASERKDVLSTLFGFLTIAAYVRYVRGTGMDRKILVVICFAFGIMSKPMVVTLPFVLLLLDLWPFKRISVYAPIEKNRLKADAKKSPAGNKGQTTEPGPARRLMALILEKWPLFLLSILSCIVTYAVQDKAGAVNWIAQGIGSRTANAVLSYGAYLVKLFFPIHLSVLYPYPQQIDRFGIILSLLLLIVVTLLCIKAIKQAPFLLVGWLWYFGTLVPVIGFVQVGQQAMADRYTYVPSVGLFIMIAWGLPLLLNKIRHGKILLGIGGSVIIVLLTLQTYRQASNWKDSVRLFSHAISVTRDNSTAQYNLGCALLDARKPFEAFDHFKEALRINPREIKACFNIGCILAAAGKPHDAIGYFNEALKLNPKDVDVLVNLANVLVEIGQTDDAILRYRAAIALEPDNADIHSNLGNALSRTGRVREAVEQYQEALRIDSNHVEALLNMGSMLARQGEMAGAVRCFEKALQINPEDPRTHNNLALALFLQGRKEEAIFHLHEALRIDPNLNEARANLDRLTRGNTADFNRR